MWNGGGETYMWHCTNYMFSSEDEEVIRKRNKYHDYYQDTDSYANLESPDEESFYSSGPDEGGYDFDYEYDYRQRQTYGSDSSMSTLEDERKARAEREWKENRNPRKALTEIQQRREQRKQGKSTQPACMVDSLSSSSDEDSSVTLKMPAPKQLKTVRKKKKLKTVTQKQKKEQEAAAAAAAAAAARAAAKAQELQNLREELVTEYMERLYHLQNKRDEAISLISEINYYHFHELHYAICHEQGNKMV